MRKHTFSLSLSHTHTIPVYAGDNRPQFAAAASGTGSRGGGGVAAEDAPHRLHPHHTLTHPHHPLDGESFVLSDLVLPEYQDVRSMVCVGGMYACVHALECATYRCVVQVRVYVWVHVCHVTWSAECNFN